MKPSVWKSTLEEFREQVGSRRPVPASGSVSAVTASMALNLLVKVLEITAHKKEFAADPERLGVLLEAARTESVRLEQYADEDVAAFNAYLESTRLSQANDAERNRRKQQIALNLQPVIEGPAQAARSAAAGIDLCAGALALVPKSLIADLGAAAALLAGAARALTLSAEFNIRKLASDRDAYVQTLVQIQDLKREVLEQERSVGRQVAAMIAGKGP